MVSQLFKIRSAATVSVKLAVSKLAKQHDDKSLLNGSKKDKLKFQKLSKSDKREWREALQRNIAKIKTRVVRRAFGAKPKGLSRHRIAQLSALEENLIAGLNATFESEYQTGAAVKTGAFVTLGAASLLAAKSVNSLSKQVSATASKAESFLDDIKRIVSDFVEKAKQYGGFLWKIALGALVIWFCANHEVPLLHTVLLTVLATFCPELVEIVRGMVETQFQDGLRPVANIIAMVTTCWCPGKDVKAVSGEFMKRVSNFPRATDGIEKFIESVMGLVEKFINFLIGTVGKDPISLVSKTNAFDIWRRKTLDYLRWFAKTPVVELEKLQEIRAHYLEGFGFQQILVTIESKREINIWMEKLAVALRPHEGALSASNNVRPLPWMMMFGGGSGVGKTSLLRYLATITLWLSGEVSAKDALANLWQKGTTEYWNGYVGQKCLVMDDAFQTKGVAGNPDSEAMQVIRAVGNWSYPLNFADVDSKGKFYLNTPLIVGTTNCENVAAEWAPFITCPEAVVRRFQSSYWVELNPAYANDAGKFDYERVSNIVHQNVSELIRRTATGETPTFDEVMGSIPWDAWVLKPHGFTSSTISNVSEPGGVAAVVKQAAKGIKDRKVANNREVDDIQKLLDMLERTEVPIDFQTGVRKIGSHEIVDSYAESESDDGDQHLNDEDVLAMINQMIVEEDEHRNQGVYGKLRLYTRKAIAAYFGLVEYMIESLNMCTFGAYRRIVGDDNATMEAIIGVLGVIGISDFLIKGVKFLVKTTSSLVSAFLELIGIKAKKPKSDYQGYETATKGVLHTRKTTKFEYANAQSVWQSGGVLQVGVPPQEKVYDKIYSTSLKCILADHVTGEEQPLGQFIGIAADVYIFPKHFLKTLSSYNKMSTLTFYRSTTEQKLTMTILEFMKLKMILNDEYDIAGVAFGMSGMKDCKNIIPLFLEQSEISSLMRGSNTPTRLVVCDVTKTKDGRVLRSKTTHTSAVTEYQKNGIVAGGDHLKGIVGYKMPTQAGDCGAPLMVSENRYYGGRCIMAIHTAGRADKNLRQGYGTIVSQEVVMSLWCMLKTYDDMIDPVEEQVEDLKIKEMNSDVFVKLQSAGLVAGSFEVIGQLEQPVNLGTVTKLMPSLMQEESIFGVSPTRPAILKPVMMDDKLVYPMVNGLKAYQTEQEYHEPRFLDNLVSHAMKLHREATVNHCRDVLSFNDAIEPPVHWKLKPLNRRSSPGFKYRCYVTPATPGKTWALGHEGDITWDSPGLQVVKADTLQLVERAKRNVRSVNLCVDFLKDELRPKAKVESVQTRVISGTPMDYSLACRMYFGAFMAATFDTYVQNGMAPGINHYTEWGLLADALNRKGTAVFDGDFSRFDSSEQPWIHESILNYINAWYSKGKDWKKEDDLVRSILWLDLVHSRHVTGLGNVLDVVMQWNKSLPSGHPLTTIVNSMYSLIAMTACYVNLTGECSMWDHAYVCTFGDDNITSVDDEMKEVFNQVTVAKAMENLGLVYTSGRKGEELVKYLTLGEVTFLKRSFVPDDDEDNQLVSACPNAEWLAPLDVNSFLYEGYWYKNARDPDGDMQRRLEHMLCELCLHPKSMWEEYGEAAIQWALKKGLTLPFYTRGECRTFVKTRFDIWF
jgi:hypothetical protein